MDQEAGEDDLGFEYGDSEYEWSACSLVCMWVSE